MKNHFKNKIELIMVNLSTCDRFLLQPHAPKYEAKQKRKFSSFFKSLVIELDKDLYGPDNHLVEVAIFLHAPIYI